LCPEKPGTQPQELTLRITGYGTVTKKLMAALLAAPFVMQLCVPLAAEVPPRPMPGLTVQSDRKADSRLLTEIPAMVQTWLSRCTAKETTGGSGAPACWREAAGEAGEYASSFSGPLAEGAGRLQLAWLQRADELASLPSVEVRKKPPKTLVQPRPSDAPNAGQASSTPPVRPTTAAEKAQRAKTVVARDRSENALPAKTRNKVAAGARPDKSRQSEEIRDAQVTPAAYVSQDPQRGQAAVGSAKTRNLQAQKKAELRAIREELDRISERVECLYRRCASGAN
jgi:hypothetical protein